VFALCDTVVLTALGQVAFMPTLVLAARMCPPGVEATLFAALMSVFNAAGVTAGALGAALTWAFGVTSDNFDNLPALIVVCNLLSLASLPFLYLLDGAPGLSRSDDEHATGMELKNVHDSGGEDEQLEKGL
jgi:BT1 family